MKIRVENTIYPLGQGPTKDKIETSRWEPTEQEILLSVDRALDRQRSDFRPLGEAADRSHTESETLCRSTGPVDRTKQRALLLQLVDRAG